MYCLVMESNEPVLLSMQSLRHLQLHKKPKTYIYGGLWLLGLFLIFLAPAPVRLTNEALDRYEALLMEAEAYSRMHQPALDVSLPHQCA
jgi:hypothetical protein